MKIQYAYQVPIGATFTTPGGFRYRVVGRGSAGVRVVSLAAAKARRFVAKYDAGGVALDAPREVEFETSGDSVVISSETEVESVEGLDVAPPTPEVAE